MPYGTVFDKATARQYAIEANRDIAGRQTWKSLYGTEEMNVKQALDAARYDYGKAMSEAYTSALAQENVIQNSNLLSGYKKDAEKDIQAALEQAYDTYYNNYLAQTQNIQENAVKRVSQIDTALETQSANTSKVLRLAYPYLQKMYDMFSGSDNDLFATTPEWSRYTTQDYDESGDVYNRLLTQEELNERLIDKEGNLTESGQEFYKQMMYDLGPKYGEEYDFFKYVYEEDKDLYDWLSGYNAYDYAPLYGNYTTNLSSLNKALGLEPTTTNYVHKSDYYETRRDKLAQQYSVNEDLERDSKLQFQILKNNYPALDSISDMDDWKKKMSDVIDKMLNPYLNALEAAADSEGISNESDNYKKIKLDFVNASTEKIKNKTYEDIKSAYNDALMEIVLVAEGEQNGSNNKGK